MSSSSKTVALAALLIVAGISAGCQSPKAGPPLGSSAARETRNNCYSLLHQLLDQEKDASILRFIKRENPDLKNLINRIAVNAATGEKLLEQFAKDDPSIPLEDIRLPPGETATRDAIGSTKQKELLSRKGEELELTLLLTQSEALNYGSHLAKVASENEPQPDRARALGGLSIDLERLNHEVFAMLLWKSSAR